MWDRVRAALRREKRDLDEAVDDFQQGANAALDKREREQTATPEEKLAMQQERGDEIDAEFDAVRKRIEGGDSTA
jgi:ribosomal protein S6E (S10)